VRSALRACGHRVHGARALRGHANTSTKGAECSHAATNLLFNTTAHAAPRFIGAAFPFWKSRNRAVAGLAAAGEK
jgi:hypothetical protein